MFITIGSRGINSDHITDVNLDVDLWGGKGVNVWLTNSPRADMAIPLVLSGEDAARFRVWWERYADDLGHDTLNQDYARIYATTPREDMQPETVASFEDEPPF